MIANYAWFMRFNGVDTLLGEAGHQVYLASDPPFLTVPKRAEFLAGVVDQALQETGAARVHLVAFSFGGSEARFLVSRLGYGDRVASVTTIGTPHRGTLIADLKLGYFNMPYVGRFMKAISDLFGSAFIETYDSEAIEDILHETSVAYSAMYDESKLPDDSSVFYQSWAGVTSTNGTPWSASDRQACGNVIAHPGTGRDIASILLRTTLPIVNYGNAELPSDGLTTVHSARWGNFRGCLPADHLDLVGWGSNGPLWATGFDFQHFYLSLANELAELEDCLQGVTCLPGGAWGTRCMCADQSAH